MRSPPTLAVVISNFNYARFLEKTLESVLAQEPPFDEIVVVDDGSTDNSREVLASYKEQIEIVTIPNGGQLGACLTGIKETNSEYIYTLDADDFVAPGLVARLRLVLASRPAKVQFQLSGVDIDGVSLGSNFPIYPRDYDSASMRRDDRWRGIHICPPTSGNVFSRSALGRIPVASYDPRGPVDGSPVFAMPYIGEVISLNEPLASYRVHAGGMSSGSKPTVPLLLREIEYFYKTWDEVIPALPAVFKNFNRANTLFVLENRLMIAGLEGRVFIAGRVSRYILKLVGSRMPLRQRVIFGLWAVALIFPSKRLKAYLIEARRSAINRPRRVQALIAFLTNNRRPETSNRG